MSDCHVDPFVLPSYITKDQPGVDDGDDLIPRYG